jgi:hypothetical protein
MTTLETRIDRWMLFVSQCQVLALLQQLVRISFAMVITLRGWFFLVSKTNAISFIDSVVIVNLHSEVASFMSRRRIDTLMMVSLTMMGATKIVRQDS